jgi:hypothetical protein
VPNLHAFVSMIKQTLPILILAPGRYLVTPLEETPSTFQFALSLMLTAGIASGVIRQARKHGWKPIHFALPFYCVIILAWPYPLMGRFLLPFLPLFLAGLWIELRRLGEILGAPFRGIAPASEKCVAGVLGALLMALLVFAGWNGLVRERRRLVARSAERGKAVEGQLQAYQWVSEHTAPGDLILAYEDPLLYLYTGRQAARPATISPAFVYLGTQESLWADSAHLADTGRSIGARFWMTSDEDFSMEGNTRVIRDRMAEIKKVLPLVFHSSDNTVQIYDSSCVAAPQSAECDAVASVLFPLGP